MSNRTRFGFLALAVVIAVVAVVVVGSGESSTEQDEPATSASQQADSQQRQANAEAEPGQPAAQAEPAPAEPTRIVLRAGQVQGEPRTIEAATGDTVEIVVVSDEEDEIHLHGYDEEKEAAPGSPARFRFEADLEGAFELESHTAEDAGLEPLIATLVVRPS